MSDARLQLDPVEAQLVARATDAAVTRRRIWYSVFAPAVLVALILGVFWHDAQPRLLVWLFVGYVGVGMLERIAYGLAVLRYKRVVRKLVARVRELEGGSVE